MTRLQAWHASCDISHCTRGGRRTKRCRIGTGAGEYTPGERRGRMSGDVRPLFYVCDLCRKATQLVTRGLLCAPVRRSATPQGVTPDPLLMRARSEARSLRADGVND